MRYVALEWDRSPHHAMSLISAPPSEEIYSPHSLNSWWTTLLSSDSPGGQGEIWIRLNGVALEWRPFPTNSHEPDQLLCLVEEP